MYEVWEMTNQISGEEHLESRNGIYLNFNMGQKEEDDIICKLSTHYGNIVKVRTIHVFYDKSILDKFFKGLLENLEELFSSFPFFSLNHFWWRYHNFFVFEQHTGEPMHLFSLNNHPNIPQWREERRNNYVSEFFFWKLKNFRYQELILRSEFFFICFIFVVFFRFENISVLKTWSWNQKFFSENFFWFEFSILKSEFFYKCFILKLFLIWR